MNAPNSQAAEQAVELRLHDIRQLFDPLDPSPFKERSLDPRAEEFIVNWAGELPSRATLALTIHLENPPGRGHDPARVAEAVRNHFAYRAEQSAWRQRELLYEGLRNLGIGLSFLAACLLTARTLESLGQGALVAVLRESLIIGGWVAMWRPMEIFLYDRWPVRRRRRLYTRLAGMSTRLLVLPPSGESLAA